MGTKYLMSLKVMARLMKGRIMPFLLPPCTWTWQNTWLFCLPLFHQISCRSVTSWQSMSFAALALSPCDGGSLTESHAQAHLHSLGFHICLYRDDLVSGPVQRCAILPVLHELFGGGGPCKISSRLSIRLPARIASSLVSFRTAPFRRCCMSTWEELPPAYVCEHDHVQKRASP